jgi:manganese efflux pump family protein
MGTIIIFGILAGLDNLEVMPALGLAGLPRSRRWMMAAGFGLFEAVMPLIGLALGSLAQKALPIADKTGPLTLIACAGLMLYMALREKDLSRLMSSGWMIVGLPLSLSLDNMVAGIGLGAVGYPILLSAILIGLISGIMALAGLFFGKLISAWIPDKAEFICAAYLIVLGLVKLI